MKKMSKYRSNGIRVVKFNIGDNNYDKTMIYYKNGKPKLERNYKNGNLEVLGQLENGFREGDWDVYNENGDLIREISYRKGEPIDSIIY